MSMTVGASYSQTLLAYQSGTQSRAARAAASFSTATAAATAESGTAEQAGEKTQTLEEFKKEFGSWISSLPVHSSQAGAYQSISIHDKAFERMMEDPEFKAQIENQIRKDLSASFSPADPAFCTMRFDENGEYSGSAGGSAHMGSFEAESRDAFWKREPKSSSRAESRREENERYLEKLAEKRRLERSELRDEYFNRLKVGNYAAPSGGGVASLLSDTPLA